ncbi:MAG: pantetheine-phosphate adenylyltransferase [Anaerolineae bacterium]|nr:pantetheine-phosphate adenylyltransferase [Anaerolineae bacterium]
MTRAIYPASFDPITNGHLDIVERAANIFDELIIGVCCHPRYNPLFSWDERLLLAREALAHLSTVRVEKFSTLTVAFAKANQATVIVRGLRVASEFEWELQRSLMNHTLDPSIDTVCLMTSQQYSFLSSSLLKDIARNKGNVCHLAPPNVVTALKEKFS